MPFSSTSKLGHITIYRRDHLESQNSTNACRSPRVHKIDYAETDTTDDTK